MRKDIHPEYREVVFQDSGADFAFLTRSCLHSKETIKWEDGNEYPLVKIEISSKSHPFYTGKHKVPIPVDVWIDLNAVTKENKGKSPMIVKKPDGCRVFLWSEQRKVS